MILETVPVLPSTRQNAHQVINPTSRHYAGALGSRGGRFSEPGSFFTFEVTPADTEGIQLAYEMGLRAGKAGQVVVLICYLPVSVMRQLEGASLVRTDPIPGVRVPETVFKPGAFERINQTAKWKIIKP
jgi:hypothetical protein